jgi:hypothetical protein
MMAVLKTDKELEAIELEDAVPGKTLITFLAISKKG